MSEQHLMRFLKCPYDEWVLRGLFAVIPFFAYLMPTALPLPLTIAGLFALKGLRLALHWRLLMGATGLLLVYAFVRSDFVASLWEGVGVLPAYKHSTKYFVAPMVMWATVWACLGLTLGVVPRSARRLIHVFALLFALLLTLQLLDSLSGFGLRNALNDRFFSHHRSNMVIVRSSDLNLILVALYWPMAYRLATLNRPLIGIFPALVLGVAAVVVGTDAQLVALVGAAIVWALARFWPYALVRKGIGIGRVLAGLSVISVLVFPLAIYSLGYFKLTGLLEHRLPESWAARIRIWSFVMDRSLEKPFWGWGFEASRTFGDNIPDHAHNMSMQIWLELGIPGLLLLATIWGAIFLNLDPAISVPPPPKNPQGSGLVSLDATDEDRPARLASLAPPYMLATATTFLILNTLSYGMWKAWLYNLAALTAIVAILALKSTQPSPVAQGLNPLAD